MSVRTRMTQPQKEYHAIAPKLGALNVKGLKTSLELVHELKGRVHGLALHETWMKEDDNELMSATDLE